VGHVRGYLIAASEDATKQHRGKKQITAVFKEKPTCCDRAIDRDLSFFLGKVIFTRIYTSWGNIPVAKKACLF
jgi:hypothetical protein